MLSFGQAMLHKVRGLSINSNLKFLGRPTSERFTPYPRPFATLRGG